MKIKKQLCSLLSALCTLLSALCISCDSADCTLNNIVLCRYGLYDAEGNQVFLQDTLTITVEGTDSVLLNRGLHRKEFELPMSYYAEADTIHLRIYGEEVDQSATICIKKENTPHFESPDCPTYMFHKITKVDWDRNSFIDSVAINKSTVNFQQDENIKIYLRTND